jgi:Pyridoxamine 5'-phosphate oxidase
MAGTGHVPWRSFEVAAPRLSAAGLARLIPLAMLGTVRQDGSPRISPIEPHLHEGELLIGAMTWSQKAADLRRDPRYVLHSLVTSPDTGETEFKLFGLAVHSDDASRHSVAGAWWSGYPADVALVFELRIHAAIHVAWDTSAQLMTVDRWSTRHGYAQHQRHYP